MVEKFLPRTRLCLFVYDRAAMLACQCLRSTDPCKADQKKVFLYRRSIRRETPRLLKVGARYFPFYRTFAFNARFLNRSLYKMLMADVTRVDNSFCKSRWKKRICSKILPFDVQFLCKNTCTYNRVISKNRFIGQYRILYFLISCTMFRKLSRKVLGISIN